MLDTLDTLDMLDMLNMLDILRDASSSVLHDPNILNVLFCIKKRTKRTILMYKFHQLLHIQCSH